MHPTDHLDANDEFSCTWTRSTFSLGLTTLVKAQGAPFNQSATHDYLLRWADHFEWQLCGGKDSLLPSGPELADNQLCGATYAELYAMDGMRNKTWIADTIKEFDMEISGNMTSVWSWVDALFMAMNTWSRIGAVTGEQKYFDQMFYDFSAAALEGPVDGKTYHFWSDEHNLFYRDDRFLNSTTFWGRGNGWAMGALVAALQHIPASSPHRAVYQGIFEKQAASLKAIQTSDGCWGASLLNETGYPPPETTGSSAFAYGIAYGINEGILSKADYLPVVENAWGCLAGTALQKSGLFGYCQPVGGSPEHNVSPNSTSDFCVGLFALATSEVAKLAATV